MKEKLVVITIPAYNEEKTLARVIQDIKREMEKTKNTYRILVVDDGSVDRTVQVAKANGAVVVSHPRNLGLAEAFKTEMRHCLDLNADIIVHTDADGQYPAKYIPLLIKKIEEGFDLVLGSRFERGSYAGSFMRRMGNVAFAKAFSILLRTRITDTTTGFRAFTRDIAAFPLINSFTYTQEQLIRAANARMKVGEIPILTMKTRPSRLFRNSFDYAIKAWINILRIYRDFAPLKFFGGIGLTLFFLGFLIGIYFIILHFTKGISGHLGLLFLMLLLIFTGIQVMLFGFLADMQRK